MHHAAESALRDASEMLGEDALIGEFGGVIGPANFENPSIFASHYRGASNFGDGENQERLKMSIERPDAFGADKKVHRSRSGIAGLIFSAIYNDESV